MTIKRGRFEKTAAPAGKPRKTPGIAKPKATTSTAKQNERLEQEYRRMTQKPVKKTTTPKSAPRKAGTTNVKKKLMIAAIAVMLALVVGVGIFLWVYSRDDGLIFDNVYALDLNLAGMTQEEAAAAIEQRSKELFEQDLTVELQDRTLVLVAADTGAKVDAQAIAQNAFNYGREGNMFQRAKARSAAALTSYTMPIRDYLELDEYYIREAVEQLATEIHTDLTQPTVTITGHFPDLSKYIMPDSIPEGEEAPEGVTVVDLDEVNYAADGQKLIVQMGTPGRDLDTEKLLEQIILAYETGKLEVISMNYEVTEPNTVTVESIRNFCLNPDEVKDPTVPPMPTNPDAPVNPDEEETEPTGTEGTEETEGTEPTEPIDPNARRYWAEPIDSVLDMETYVASQEVLGYGLDTQALQVLLDQAKEGETFELEFQLILPEITKYSIESKLFQDVLVSINNKHTWNTKRTTNLRLACEAINGYILKPGATFSFNDVVGERTKAKGYQEAAVYSGGNTVDQLGGGVCQIASTLYYGALLCDLEIVERAAHMFTVDYVPMGADATIYWDSGLDFKFKNNTDYPIKIIIYVEDGKVWLEYLGTETKDYTVKLKWSEDKTTKYETIELIYDEEAQEKYPGHEIGDTVVSPYTGHKGRLFMYKYDKETGELIETLLVNNSDYSKRDKIVLIADPESTEPTEPAPTEPKPTDPKPTDPEPTDPEPTDPPPTDPEPTDPPPTETDPDDPGNGGE